MFLLGVTPNHNHNMKQEEPKQEEPLGLGFEVEGVEVEVGEENGFLNEIIKSMLTPGKALHGIIMAVA